MLNWMGAGSEKKESPHELFRLAFSAIKRLMNDVIFIAIRFIRIRTNTLNNFGRFLLCPI